MILNPPFVIGSLFFALVSIGVTKARAAEVSLHSKSSTHVSIYHIDPLKDGAIIGLTSAGSLWAYTHSERLIHPRCPCEPSDVNSFDRPVIGNSNDFLDHLSDYTVAAAVIFPVVLDFTEVGWSKQFGEDMTVLAESLSVNGGLVTLTKYTVQRPLPRTYQNDPNLVENPRGYRSFYSGHTSVALSTMTTAVVTHYLRHPEDVWPIAVTALVGTSVAYERVAAGRHFYSDVIVGAMVGIAIGTVVPLLHRRTSANESTIAVSPVEDGAIIFWKFKI